MCCYRVDWVDSEGFACQDYVNAENIHDADALAYEVVGSHNYTLTLTGV